MLGRLPLSSGYLCTYEEATTHIIIPTPQSDGEAVGKTELLGPMRWLSRQRCLQSIPRDLISTPRVHIKVRGEKRLPKVVPWPTHMHHGRRAHTDTCVGSSKSLVRKLLLDLPPNPGRMRYWLDTGQCQGKPATEEGLEFWSSLLVCLLSFITEDKIITLEKCCEFLGAGMHNVLAPNCKCT